MNAEEYQAEYDKAAAELDAAAQATTARGADGRFAKASPEPEPKEPAEAKTEPAVETPPEPKTPEKQPDELAELRARVERAEKMAKDNQAAFTRAAQEAAQLKREREQREREAAKPAILDANPELADAIRFVAHDPAPQQQQQDGFALWKTAVERAHPGIFQVPDGDELVAAITARREQMGEAWGDPLEAIRAITEEKLAHTERQVGKRFAVESAKLAQKSAMSVPGAGAGSGAKAPVDAQLAEVQRIHQMSDADFAKEVRRVKGY